MQDVVQEGVQEGSKGLQGLTPEPLNDALCYAYLQEMGITVWVPQGASLPENLPLTSELVDLNEAHSAESVSHEPSEEVAPSANKPRAMAMLSDALLGGSAPGASKAEVMLSPNSDTSPMTEVSPEGAEVAESQEAAEPQEVPEALRYALLLQPITANVLMLCELNDSDASALSQAEAKLLVGILNAAGRLSAVSSEIVLSHNFFRWPVVSESQKNALFSDRLFAFKALEGLLHGQVRQGVTDILLLSDQLTEELDLPEGCSIHRFHSLAHMASGDRAAKGALWQCLQTRLS